MHLSLLSQNFERNMYELSMKCYTCCLTVIFFCVLGYMNVTLLIFLYLFILCCICNSFWQQCGYEISIDLVLHIAMFHYTRRGKE